MERLFLDSVFPEELAPRVDETCLKLKAAAKQVLLSGTAQNLSVDRAQKLSYWAAVLTRQTADQLMNWLVPLLAWACRARVQHSANWQPASPLGNPRVGGLARFPPELYSRYECMEHRLVRRMIYNRCFGSFHSFAPHKRIHVWRDEQDQKNKTRTTAPASTLRAKKRLRPLWWLVWRNERGANWAEKTLGP